MPLSGSNTRSDTAGSPPRLVNKRESPSRSSTDTAGLGAGTAIFQKTDLPQLPEPSHLWPLHGKVPLVLPMVSSSALGLSVQILSTLGCFPPQQLGTPSASALLWMFIGLAPSHRSCFRLNACLCPAASEHTQQYFPSTHISLLSSTLFCLLHNLLNGASQVALVKNPLPKAGDTGSIPGSGRSPEKKIATHSSIFCLENFKNRGGGQATVHGTTKRHDRMTEHTCMQSSQYLNTGFFLASLTQLEAP